MLLQMKLSPWHNGESYLKLCISFSILALGLYFLHSVVFHCPLAHYQWHGSMASNIVVHTLKTLVCSPSVLITCSPKQSLTLHKVVFLYLAKRPFRHFFEFMSSVTYLCYFSKILCYIFRNLFGSIPNVCNIVQHLFHLSNNYVVAPIIICAREDIMHWWTSHCDSIMAKLRCSTAILCFNCDIEEQRQKEKGITNGYSKWPKHWLTR